MWTILVTSALAGAPAFYHPDDIAARSARFGEVAAQIQPRFERGQDTVSRLSGALADLEVSVGLLGSSAPPGLSTWFQVTRRQVTGQYLRLNKHAELVQEDFSNVFLESLGRALPALSVNRTVRECKATGVVAMMHRTTCEGEDLNAPLAAAIDADGKLGRDLASILSVEWPSVVIDPVAQPVVALTGTAQWADFAVVARTFIAPRLASRMDAFERELAPLEDALDAKDAAAIQAAGTKKQAYLDALAQDGVALRAALVEAVARSRPPFATVGLCANPALLGGCSGEDVTGALVAALQADRKFIKALAPFQTP